MSDLQSLRRTLEQQKGRKAQIQSTIDLTRRKIREKKRDLKQHEQAREVIREVGLKTQQQLQYHISEITSLALSAVFDDPYELVVEFVQRRNKTECDLLFERDGERIDPLSASGGGAVDIASFALRVASWSMQRPRSRNLLILDEPFKHLSPNLMGRASEMLKEISERLKLQILMVTHSAELTECADRLFKVKLVKGISTVEQGG